MVSFSTNSRTPTSTSNRVEAHPGHVEHRQKFFMLNIVKNSILGVTRFFGYDIVPLRAMKERDLALHLRAVLAQANVDCILDVGANVDQDRDFLRNKGWYRGHIVSFEPVSRHVDLLRDRAPFDNA